MNIDETADVASQYGISSVPAFRAIRNGAVVGSVDGANADELGEMIGANI